MTAWALTVVFTVTGMLYAWRAATFAMAPGRCVDGVVGAVIHTMSCGVMIVTLWTAASAVVSDAAMVFFAMAAGWFAREAIRSTLAVSGGSWYHAGMMASMVWMAYVTAPKSSPSSHGRETMAHSMSVIAAPMGVEAPIWMKTACQALAVAFFVTAVGTVVVGVSRNQGAGRGRLAAMHVVAGCLMSVGMGLAFTRMAL